MPAGSAPTLTDREPFAGVPDDGPALLAVLRAEAPRAPSRRLGLTDLDEVVLLPRGSRRQNGTFRQGVRIDRSVVSHGDVIELGHTFFVFQNVLNPGGHAGR